MPSKTSSSEYDGTYDAFMEALDGFISGLISLERVRVTIPLLLEGNLEAADDMQDALDSTLRDGHIDKSAYIVLSTVIDLVTSEDEPTESPRHETSPALKQPLRIAAITPEACGAMSPAEMKPGMTLRDRFTLLEPIGSGSMGTIFKAVDRRKEESGSATPWVAIKSITEELSSPPNALLALQKEAANAQRLSHPNIIRVFDFDRDGEQVFMTMELLDGASLAELMNENRFQPLPGKQARTIIEDLCHGLIYAHDLGIIHADVKPGNIFVTRDENTKLLDFGISLAINDISEKSDVYAHTPSYASCEVLEGAAPTAQDDVYSLACVAYRMLAGRRAYDGATAHAAEAQKLELSPIEHITQSEWMALCHALAFRRADRTADVLSFLNEFSAIPTVSALPEIREPDETTQSSPFVNVPQAAGLFAALVAIIAVAAAVWPEQQVLQPTLEHETAVLATSVTPVLTEMPKPADIGPPLELRTSKTSIGEEIIAPKSPAQSKPEKLSVAPARLIPKKNPMSELAKKAEVSLNQRLLLGPAENSAKLYISKMQSIDPKANEFIQARRRFTDLMMLEVMVAIADEDFAAADTLIAETKSLGVEEETERYEIALMKARDARTVRESDPLGSIFVSTTPVAVLANPDYGQIPVTGPLSISALEPGTEDDLFIRQPTDLAVPDETPGDLVGIPDAPSFNSTPETLSLSALEFKHRVQPEYPKKALARKLSGWVDLRFLVNTQGNTENIQVMDSEPKGSFEKAATKAIAKWRFKPVMVDGMPAETYSIVRLRFSPE